MRRIATVAHTDAVPEEVLAQAVAGFAHWYRDDAGAVYDQDEIFVASSLAEAAAAMRHLGWISPDGAQVSGVYWRRIDATVAKAHEGPQGERPSNSRWGALVRGAVRALRRGGPPNEPTTSSVAR